MSKKVLGFSVSIWKARVSSDYGQLRITFRQFEQGDYAKQCADAVKHGSNWSASDAMAKATKLRESTGTTEYLTDATFDASFTLRWQDDSERRDDWYGIRCELDCPDDETIDLLRKVRKAYEASLGKYNAKPRELIQKLVSAGFVPVKCVDDMYNCYVQDKEFDLSTAIPAPKAEEVTA